MTEENKKAPQPGCCVPWEEKRKELPIIPQGDGLYQQIWENNDALAYMYIWQILLSF